MQRSLLALTVCSGVALLSTLTVQFSDIAHAAELNAEESALQAASEAKPETKIVCSRKPIEAQLMASKSLDGLVGPVDSGDVDWSQRIVRLFCRDVRINTIVVRDYCAVLRA